jgi:glyoxylase-like metal-dependent hydrolase (beta-lactamase superfamily II)
MTAAVGTTGHGAASSPEVLAVRYGTLSTHKSALFYRYSAYGEPDATQEMDYFFWVVRGGGRTILVDTGFEPGCGERRGRTCLISPQEALARLGVDPLEVEEVIITHFHYDHIGNVGLFPNAELTVPEEEFRFYTSPMARRFQLSEHVEASEVDVIAEAHRAGRVKLVSGTTAIAPGITGHVVGGHAPGQMIVSIDTGNGKVVLTSNAVHLYEEIQKDRPFSVLVDLPGMYAAFDLLRDLERDGATVVPGHDPEVTSKFPPLDAEHAGIAHRLS